jgi:hypothetical protein
MFIYINVYMHKCIYAHVYMYIYLHAYIYIYTGARHNDLACAEVGALELAGMNSNKSVPQYIHYKEAG